MIRSSIEELVLTIDVLEGLDTFTFEDYFTALYRRKMHRMLI